MKFLTVVFSFERLAYLKNCVRSIDEFFPWGDGLIVDDGTDGPRMNEYLNGLSARWKYKIFNKSGSERFSTFYRNMAYALQYSIEADYDYCLFIEDDEQFVWKKDDYPEYIESFFTVMSDAIQLSPLFSRRVVPYDNRLEYIESSKSYKTIRGFNTTAFWDIRKIRRINGLVCR